MQPNGNVIVDTICRTAKLGTTITGATENGDVTVIEAEPVEPINECPTCGQERDAPMLCQADLRSSS